MGVGHVMAIEVKGSSIGMVKPLHAHELHILRRLPVPFPLVYEPIIYLFLIQPSGFRQRQLFCLLRAHSTQTKLN